MNLFLVVLIIVSVFSAAFFWLVHMSSRPDPKRRYLPKLEAFVGGRLEEIITDGNTVTRISFLYKDLDCIFDEVAEQGFYDRVMRMGYLRTKASKKDFSLSFTERTRTTMRSTAKTIADLAVTWGGDSGQQLIPPRELKEFNVHTNQVKSAQALLADEGVVKIFSAYKNLDYRGHPVMSLEMNSGFLVLRFHVKDNLVPGLLELEHNVTIIEEHLERFYTVVAKLRQIEASDENAA